MTWFRVDDTLAMHPKVVSAGNAAMGLWVRAGSWASQQLTDGHVPTYMLAPLGGRPRDAVALVSVGLWVVVDDGWLFHEWADRQPSRERVEAMRTADAERQRRHRESRRDKPMSPRTPTRPDPTPAGERAPAPLLAPTARPAPTCSRHPEGTGEPCRACGDARRRYDAWSLPPTPTPPTLHEDADAPRCDEHGAIVGRCALCRRQGLSAV